MGTTVVAGGDAPPVLQSAEGVLDPVSLAVEHPVVGQGQLARACRGDAGNGVVFCQLVAEPGAVVAAVAEQLAHRRQDRQQQRRTMVVASLPFGQHQPNGPSMLVGGGVQL